MAFFIFKNSLSLFSNTQARMANPNGKKGSQKHQEVQKAELKKLEEEYNLIENVEVDKEITVSTPNGKKKSRVADVAAYSTDQPFQYMAIVQIGKTDRDGKPVKREQEAIEDIEKHTNIKVKFVDFEKYIL